MRNVLPAFEFRDDNVMPPGFKKIHCHMVFDVKLDLVRKARFVAVQNAYLSINQTQLLVEDVLSTALSAGLTARDL
jgi:hypothetical protein